MNQREYGQARVAALRGEDRGPWDDELHRLYESYSSLENRRFLAFQEGADECCTLLTMHMERVKKEIDFFNKVQVRIWKKTEDGPMTAPGRIVMARYGTDDNFQYVTWFYNEQLNGFSQGHYYPGTFEGFQRALNDFEFRS